MSGFTAHAVSLPGHRITSILMDMWTTNDTI